MTSKAAIQAAIRANQSASLAPPPPRREPEKRKSECSTGKARFTTWEAAETRLSEIHGQSHTGRPYGPIKVHGPCRKCGGFHLTAKEGKSWKSGKARR